MASLQGGDACDHGHGIVDRSKIQIVNKAGGIQAPRNQSRTQQRAQLRSEQKILSRGTVVERLDAHGIASQQQARALGVPDGEGKHSTQLAYTLLAPAAISFQQHFGIGLADKAHAFALQSRPEFAKVVDFAVVDDPVAGFRILHGLMAQRREIENRQAAAAQSNFEARRGVGLNDDCPAVVRPAMRQRIRGLLQEFRRNGAVTRQNAEDAAHEWRLY